MMKWCLVGLITGLMIACQSIEITDNKFPCSQLDWFELGRSDGLQGKASDSFKKKKLECEDFNEDYAVSYGNGWYAGVDQFCSPDNGFAFGRSGYKYQNVCPAIKETNFLKSFVKGKKIFEYESKNRQLAQELVELGKSSKTQNPEENRKTLKKMTAIETELELNKALIAEIQKDLDGSLSQ